MKFGFRKPSFKKRIAARTSLKRTVRHNLGLKAPRGMGWLTNPKKAAYNRVYNRTSKGCAVLLVLALILTTIAVLSIFAVGQKNTAELRREHAAALQKYLAQTKDRHFLSETAIEPEDLRFLRKEFGQTFRPYYLVGDFNFDKLQDFALILGRSGKPKLDGEEGAVARQNDHDLSFVVFNQTHNGGYRVAHVEDLEVPLSCFIWLSDERRNRLYFAVAESDADTFSLYPAGAGYIVRYEGR